MKPPFFLDPRFWLAFIVWTGLVVLGAYAFGHSEATATAKAEEAGRTAQALAGLASENAKVLANERTLRAADRAALDTFQLKESHAKAETDRLISDLRRDVVRLRVPIRATGAAKPHPGGQAPEQLGEEGHAELSSDGSIFLVGLLARGDEGIRKHAEVVDRYERLRLACNDESPTAQTAQPTGESP